MQIASQGSIEITTTCRLICLSGVIQWLNRAGREVEEKKVEKGTVREKVHPKLYTRGPKKLQNPVAYSLRHLVASLVVASFGDWVIEA